MKGEKPYDHLNRCRIYLKTLNTHSYKNIWEGIKIFDKGANT
jgi:hypothetical protein